MTANEVPPLGNCPVCQSPLLRLWGEGWDWDRALCSNRSCDYDVELDAMTGHDPDGSIYQTHKDKEENR